MYGYLIDSTHHRNIRYFHHVDRRTTATTTDGRRTTDGRQAAGDNIYIYIYIKTKKIYIHMYICSGHLLARNVLCSALVLTAKKWLHFDLAPYFFSGKHLRWERQSQRRATRVIHPPRSGPPRRDSQRRPFPRSGPPGTPKTSSQRRAAPHGAGHQVLCRSVYHYPKPVSTRRGFYFQRERSCLTLVFTGARICLTLFIDWI